MDNILDAHYFLLPSQGNIYTLSKITQTNGVNKVLFSSLKRKLFLLEYHDHLDGCLKPVIKEILFTYIPNGAEIISLDVFNKSTVCDDFFIGITIIKPNPDHNNETYLNIYSEQDLDVNPELNIESIAQNCLSIDLNFVPYQLYHTQILRQFDDAEPRRETNSFIYYNIDYQFYSRRITAFGCECGHMQISVVDTVQSTILSSHVTQFEGSVSRVQLFNLCNYVNLPALDLISDKHRKQETKDEMAINVVVTSTLQLSAVFMDIVNQGLNVRCNLEGSDKYDSVLCSCLADVDMDGEVEIIIGTYAQELLMYKYEADKWELKSRRSLELPIQSLLYVDVTGDGMRELIVLTLGGLHVMQHNQDLVYDKLQNRLKQLFKNEELPTVEKEKDLIEKTEDERTDESETDDANVSEYNHPIFVTGN
ncbi:KICSTOR complex protein kaptin-like [Nilaparvata lugens]|uniref:KICSTOR complex protein kaptin-like n=1 Tax=Nilaparvata lugens TaxID=108931 RepID=UPI00193CBF42|nr:KICSTOR complex protein kaptin-like [Nilaparvata lugens]